jgi:prevent-host-death family protein
MEWQLQDAKNRFSELVQRARREGPQVVTLRGRRAAVVLSAEDYDQLAAGHPSLVDHLLSGPPWPDDLVEAVNARAKRPSRDAVAL